MKMVYVTCNVGVAPVVQRMCEELEIKSYQVVNHVLAKNRKGDHRFNDEVWPGYNAILLFQFSDPALYDVFMARLASYNEQVDNPNELLTVASWGLDQFFY
ncbi:MAG: hypothetical protein CSA97_01875 [Bacteroidetes bacterium]|nr:MAG: hypothetical protein CSA97_01875 [Bacteroidota bacterium]